MPRPPAKGNNTTAKKQAIKRYYASHNTVKGHGDYKAILSKLGSIAKHLAAPAATAIGTALGQPELGAFAGHIISKLTGSGAYVNNADKLRYNSLFNKSADGVQIPSFGETERSTRIKHREYIGDLIAGPTGSPTLFNTWQNVYVNPALLDSFAWLSQVAENYDSYMFHGLVFEYKAMSGMATGTNTQLGNVIFSAQYNSANPPFTNKLQMENYQGACSCNPSENMLFGIECDPKDLPLNHLYTRTGQVPTGQTQQVYDLCSLQIATQGVPTESQILGEIWVTYDVELFQPKLFAGQVGNGILTANYYSTNSSCTMNAADHAFVGMVADAGNTLGVSLTTDGTHAGVLVLDESLVTGKYLLHYTSQGSTVACSTPTVTLVNAIPLNIFGTPTSPSNVVSIGATTSGSFWFCCAFEIDNDNAQPVQVQLGVCNVSSTNNFTNMIITQIGGLIDPIG